MRVPQFDNLPGWCGRVTRRLEASPSDPGLSSRWLQGTGSRRLFVLSSQMKAVSVHTVNPLLDNRWDDLVARHPKASAFHQRGWLEALARTYGYEPVVFTTSAPNRELKNGLVFCRINSWITGRRLVSLPFSDHCEVLCDSAEDVSFLIRHLQIVLERQEWKYLELRPINGCFDQTRKGIGFLPSASYFLHTLDLRPDLDELFRSLDKDSVQRRIGRAERAGLVEKCGRSDDLLKEFYALFVMTRSRHHVPPIPYAWFHNLIHCLGNALEIRVAYKDSNPIAAILTLQFRDVVYFKYGCSDARFKGFGATPWLLWRAIRAAKSNRAVAFDMGRTQLDNVGLLAFKNHWVHEPKRLVYWQFPGTPSLASVGGWKLRMAKRIFSNMPNRLLTIAGNLIYRHIG
jgi:GNAT acetyltransferase-like protein